MEQHIFCTDIDIGFQKVFRIKSDKSVEQREASLLLLTKGYLVFLFSPSSFSHSPP